MTEWQPIATAPEGMFVLVCFDSGDIDIARHIHTTWLSIEDLDFGYGWDMPTHWMPLPAPPERS